MYELTSVSLITVIIQQHCAWLSFVSVLANSENHLPSDLLLEFPRVPPWSSPLKLQPRANAFQCQTKTERKRGGALKLGTGKHVLTSFSATGDKAAAYNMMIAFVEMSSNCSVESSFNYFSKRVFFCSGDPPGCFAELFREKSKMIFCRCTNVAGSCSTQSKKVGVQIALIFFYIKC